jgi:hypothetical protein
LPLAALEEGEEECHIRSGRGGTEKVLLRKRKTAWKMWRKREKKE